MLLAALALAQTTQTFTLEQARAMPPGMLADLILGPNHDPVQQVVVHPVGMEAPSRSLLTVTMVGVPKPAKGAANWCRRIDKIAHFKPLTPDSQPYVTAVPTRLERIEQREYVRLADSNCGRTDAAFFPINRTTRDTQFALFERLLEVRTLAKSSQPLPFELRCMDQDGARKPAFGGDRCVQGNGRALLANLPLEQTYNVSPGGEGRRYNFSRVNGTRSEEPLRFVAEAGMSDGRMAIDISIAQKDGQISWITIKRHIPYPP